MIVLESKRKQICHVKELIVHGTRQMVKAIKIFHLAMISWSTLMCSIQSIIQIATMTTQNTWIYVYECFFSFHLLKIFYLFTYKYFCDIFDISSFFFFNHKHKDSCVWFFFQRSIKNPAQFFLSAFKFILVLFCFVICCHMCIKSIQQQKKSVEVVLFNLSK